MTINQALIASIKAYESGDTASSKKLLNKIIQIEPSHPDANSNMGVILMKSGDLDQALPYFKTALESNPTISQYWFNYIEALFELSRFTEASNLIVIAKRKGCKGQEFDKLSEKINSATFNQTIKHLKKLIDQGQVAEALLIAHKLLEKLPHSISLLNIIAAANRKIGNFDFSLDVYNQILQLKVSDAVYNNIGIVLAEQGKLEEAEKAFNKALKLDANQAQTYQNLGNVFQNQGKLEEATAAYKKALAIRPDYAEAYCNMGIALADQGKREESVAAYNQALTIRPDYAEAHNNIGTVLSDQGKMAKAIEAYKKAITINPDDTNFIYNMGIALQKQFKTQKAIEAYSRVLSIDPSFAQARAARLHQQQHICDWDGIAKDHDLISGLGISKSFVTPFMLLPLEDAPDRHLLRSKIYAKAMFPQKPLPLPARPSKKPERIRIAYFSTDFREHPVSYLIAGVLEQHNRSQFEVFGYSLQGNTQSEMGQRLKNSFDLFVDVQTMSDAEIALRARHDKIDIAIDLTGYTSDCRARVFAHRAAPIQINYLGYPGTMGADFMDYIIADKNLIPIKNQKYYSEKPIYLPHHYQAQDETSSIAHKTPSRSALGLPEDAFVFCAFHGTYKINSSQFSLWMRLLKKVNGSVLWLLETNDLAKANLLKNANAMGIASERLVFAKFVSQEKYLAQFKQADLYLDTFIINAGATASNALWAGLPILTKLGEGYSARMAGSLLQSLGLSELIATTEEQYENLAFNLAKNPLKILSIRKKIEKNLLSKPLFNTKLFTKHLEHGYQQAYQNYFDGKAPKSIVVPT